MEIGAGIIVGVVGIVVGNLILNGIKGNKKVTQDAFDLFVQETRDNFKRIDDRLLRIEQKLSETR